MAINNSAPGKSPAPKKGHAAVLQMQLPGSATESQVQVFVSSDGYVQVGVLVMAAHFDKSGVFDECQVAAAFGQDFAATIYQYAKRVLDHAKDEEPRIVLVGH